MKKIFGWILIFAALVGCQEVVELDLENGEPRYVIQAELTFGDSLARVQVSKSVGISETNDFPQVTGALIEITDELGTVTTLVEDSAGYYSAPFDVQEGTSYIINVQHDGQIFTSQSTTPAIVALDSVGIIENSGFGLGGFLLVPYYQDPAGSDDYYAFIYYKITEEEGVEPLSNLVLRDDELTNGLVSEQPIFEGFPVFSGDTILLSMFMITADENLYRFSKSQNTSPDSGAPADPVSNWNENALGYFAIRGYDEQYLIIP